MLLQVSFNVIIYKLNFINQVTLKELDGIGNQTHDHCLVRRLTQPHYECSLYLLPVFHTNPQFAIQILSWDNLGLIKKNLI